MAVAAPNPFELPGPMLEQFPINLVQIDGAYGPPTPQSLSGNIEIERIHASAMARSALELIAAPGIGPWSIALLLAVSFVASLITAVFSLGGGILMLATMAMVLPAAVVIPLHAVVQLGSNGIRCALQWRHVDWGLLTPFLVGNLLGAVAGGWFVVELPASVFEISIGLFLLMMIWAPWLWLKPMQLLGDRGDGQRAMGVTGLITGGLTMLFGATGPMIVAMLRGYAVEKMTFSATHAAAMSAQHAVKIVVFLALGAALSAYLPLVVAVIIVGALGTVAGGWILVRLSGERFALLLDIAITVMAARLLWSGLIQ